MKIQKIVGVLLFSLVMATSVHAAGSWVPAPCDNPSQCNAVPPIHEGGESQAKTGLLGLRDFLLSNSFRFATSTAQAGYVLTSNDTLGNATWRPNPGFSVGGTPTWGNAIIANRNGAPEWKTPRITAGPGLSAVQVAPLDWTIDLTASGGQLSGGLANYLPKWLTQTTLGNSAIYESAGKVAIGNTAPTYPLDVHSSSPTESIAARFKASAYGTTDVKLENSTGKYWLLSTRSTGGTTANDDTFSIKYNNKLISSPLTIESGGNVGLSMPYPAERLDVNGNVRVNGLTGNTAPAKIYMQAKGDTIVNDGTNFQLNTDGTVLVQNKAATAQGTLKAGTICLGGTSGAACQSAWPTIAPPSFGGSGTINTLPKFNTATTVANSHIIDDGSTVTVQNTTAATQLDVVGKTKTTNLQVSGFTEPYHKLLTFTDNSGNMKASGIYVVTSSVAKGVASNITVKCNTGDLALGGGIKNNQSDGPIGSLETYPTIRQYSVTLGTEPLEPDGWYCERGGKYAFECRVVCLDVY